VDKEHESEVEVDMSGTKDRLGGEGAGAGVGIAVPRGDTGVGVDKTGRVTSYAVGAMMVDEGG
jgi:hypothetical protein